MTTAPQERREPVVPLLFRRAEPTDYAYVISTWLDSYRPEQPEMRTSDFEAWQRGRIGGDVLLACAENEPTVIRGWISVDQLEPFTGRLHYVYVRRRYRGQGIARALFERATGGVVGGMLTVTHLTADGRAIKKAKPDRFRYIPT